MVDLDPAITEIGANHPMLQEINEFAFRDPRLTCVNQDAFQYIENLQQTVDLIIIDLPDPHNASLGKLYSQSFYQLILSRLNVGGTVITQSTSPYFAPKAFWCVYETMRSVFPTTYAFHTYVPTFGQWGFNVAIKSSPKMVIPDQIPTPPTNRIQKKLANTQIPFKYLTPEIVPGLFEFDGDTKRQKVEINRLDNQMLIQYYEESWQNWD